MTVEQARNIVEQEFKLDISTRTRIRKYIAARSVYYHICIKYGKISYDEFTSFIGYDHSTVINAKKRMKNDIQTEFWEYKTELKICNERAMLLSNMEDIELVKKFDSITKLGEEFKRDLYKLVNSYLVIMQAYENKIKLENMDLRTSIKDEK